MEKKKPDIFQLLFIVPAAVLVPKFNVLFAGTGMNPLLLAGGLGCVGALFGLGVAKLAENKSTFIKIILLVAELALLFSALIFLTKK